MALTSIICMYWQLADLVVAELASAAWRSVIFLFPPLSLIESSPSKGFPPAGSGNRNRGRGVGSRRSDHYAVALCLNVPQRDLNLHKQHQGADRLPLSYRDRVLSPTTANQSKNMHAVDNGLLQPHEKSAQ